SHSLTLGELKLVHPSNILAILVTEEGNQLGTSKALVEPCMVNWRVPNSPHVTILSKVELPLIEMELFPELLTTSLSFNVIKTSAAFGKLAVVENELPVTSHSSKGVL